MAEAADRWMTGADADPHPLLWPRPDEGRIRKRAPLTRHTEGVRPWENGADWAVYERRRERDDEQQYLDDEEREEWARIEGESEPDPDVDDEYEALSWQVGTYRLDDRPLWERELDEQPALQEVRAEPAVPMRSASASIGSVGQQPESEPAPVAMCSHCDLAPVAVHKTERWGQTWYDLCGRCRKYVIRNGRLPTARLNYWQEKRRDDPDLWSEEAA